MGPEYISTRHREMKRKMAREQREAIEKSIFYGHMHQGNMHFGKTANAIGMMLPTEDVLNRFKGKTQIRKFYKPVF